MDDIVKFRCSQKWQKKRNQIKKRDSFLCHVCIRELYGTRRKYTYENLEVHRTDECGNILVKSTGNSLITNCKEGSYNYGN